MELSPAALIDKKNYSNEVWVGYKDTVDWLLMKVLNSFEFLEFKIILISFEKSH